MKIAVFASGEGTNLQALLDACADGRVRGAFESTGVRPQFTDRFAAHGIPLPAALLRVHVDV